MKTNPKALVIGFHFEWQLKIINNLCINPIYHISSDIENKDLVSQETIHHPAIQAALGERAKDFIDSNIPLLDNSFYEEHLDLINTVYRMLMIRKDDFPFEKKLKNDALRRRWIYEQISYWSYIIDSLKIETILLESIPHLPHHYIPYYLGKEKKLQVLFFNRVGEPNRIIVCHTLDDITPFSETPFTSNQQKEAVKPISTSPKYSDTSKMYKKSITRFLKTTFSMAFNDRQKLKTYLNSRISPKYLFRPLYLWFRKQPYLKKYQRLALETIPNKDYIYYPLHEQPEDTSFPIGRNYEDQIYAILSLSKVYKKDLSILVKEHPNQQFYRGRYPSYYDDLASIPGVQLIKMKHSSFDIINHPNCKAVATISGQAGWESISNGKPAILFGQAWYYKCKYAYLFETLKKDPFLLYTKIERDEIDHFYQLFLKNSHEGYLSQISKPSSTLTEEENITSVSNALNIELEKLAIK